MADWCRHDKAQSGLVRGEGGSSEYVTDSFHEPVSSRTPNEPPHPSPRPNDSLAPARSARWAFTNGEFLSSLPKLLKSPLRGEGEAGEPGLWSQCARKVGV